MPTAMKQDPNREDYFLIEKQVGNWTEYKKKRPDLSSLYQSTDRPIAVLGAGMSLPSDLKKIPKDCIRISCNHHALKIVDCDFMAFLDPVDSNHSQEFKDVVRKGNTPRVSVWNLDYTDYYCINEDPWHQASDTGRFATWLACYITSGDVLLCGMNLRVEGEPNHFYDNPEEVNHWGGSSLETKMKQWGQALEKCHRPERIKAVSGRLTEIFGLYSDNSVANKV